MNALFQAIQQRQERRQVALKSAEGFDAPSLMRNHVAILRKDTLGYQDAESQMRVGTLDPSKMYARFLVTKFMIDREGDGVVPRGCLPHLDNFRRNPVWFFNHQDVPFPIGRCIHPVTRELDLKIDDETIEAGIWFHGKTAESNIIWGLLNTDPPSLNATSMAFVPIIGQRLKKSDGPPNSFRAPRFLVKEWDLIEISICGAGMNPGVELISVGLDKGMLFGERLSDGMRKALTPLAAKRSGAVRSGYDAVVHGGMTRAAFARIKARPLAFQKGTAYGSAKHSVRWNPGLDESFDVAGQEIEPYCMLIDWVSRYLKTPVKKIYETSQTIPHVKLGNYLSGLRAVLAEEFEAEDTRNLHGQTEGPPFYDTIQLNSKKSDTFLLTGTVFYKGQQHPLVLDVAPTWSGLQLTWFADFQHRGRIIELQGKVDEWVKANNFLRGEKFSLSGEFLPLTGEDWPDLFLTEDNFKPVKSVVDRINLKGKDAPNHGTILSGPPGTGKTLSGRIVMNKCQCTFIWVSARDFHYAGSFGGMTMAFDLAKDLAPSVILFEDVDNWMGESSIDFMKTEMDGVARYKGVWTIITTNFPERIPEALIDRPGRFHDVLQFAVPTPETRKAMLSKWVPGISPGKLVTAVHDTEDYSGAHLYHLAAFAKSLMESEGLDVDAAVDLAIAKVREQRELINGIQLEGSRYRPRKDVAALMAKGLKKGASSDYLPFFDGYQARTDNLPITSNVNPPGDDRVRWEAGWNQRDEEIRAELKAKEEREAAERAAANPESAAEAEFTEEEKSLLAEVAKGISTLTEVLTKSL